MRGDHWREKGDNMEAPQALPLTKAGFIWGYSLEMGGKKGGQWLGGMEGGPPLPDTIAATAQVSMGSCEDSSAGDQVVGSVPGQQAIYSHQWAVILLWPRHDPGSP